MYARLRHAIKCIASRQQVQREVALSPAHMIFENNNNQTTTVCETMKKTKQTNLFLLCAYIEIGLFIYNNNSVQFQCRVCVCRL